MPSFINNAVKKIAAQPADEHLMMGAAMAGAKLLINKYGSTKIVEYLSRTFVYLPKLSLAGGFGLGLLVSLVSDLVITTKKLHLEIKDTDSSSRAAIKHLGQLTVTVLTGVVLTAAFAGATALATGALLGATVYLAKKIYASVFDKFYFSKTNAFLNLNITNELERAKNIVQLLAENLVINYKKIDYATFLSKNKNDVIEVTINGEKHNAHRIKAVYDIRDAATDAINMELLALSAYMDEANRLDQFYEDINPQDDTRSARKKIQINMKIKNDLEPLRQRIVALQEALNLWEKFDIFVEDVD